MITDTEQIYTEFYPKVLSYVRGRVHQSDAEDVTADVFVKVYANIDSYDSSKAGLSTWIYTITRNTVYDYLRSRRNTQVSLEEYTMSRDIASVDDMDGLLSELADALQTLPLPQRDAVVLHYYFGLSHREIADRMNISYPNARKLCSLAIAALKKRMEL